MSLHYRAAFVTAFTFLIVSLMAYGMILLDRHNNHGYCTPTGDFAESDNFTIQKDFRNGRGNVLGKDGRMYYVIVCPTTDPDWFPGDHIEYARYEFRNGCMDFSSPQAYFKLGGR